MALAERTPRALKLGPFRNERHCLFGDMRPVYTAAEAMDVDLMDASKRVSGELWAAKVRSANESVCWPVQRTARIIGRREPAPGPSA